MSECVAWGPIKENGRAIMIECTDRRCTLVGVCRLQADFEQDEGVVSMSQGWWDYILEWLRRTWRRADLRPKVF